MERCIKNSAAKRFLVLLCLNSPLSDWFRLFDDLGKVQLWKRQVELMLAPRGVASTRYCVND